MYWSYFWEFVKRNILTIVVLAVVAVVLPWTLIFIIPVAIIILRLQMAVWKMQENLKKASAQQQQHQYSSTNEKSTKEGNVTVVRTEQAEQRVSNDVGEYVDFKEINEEETK